tara:strand:- start:737 stop:1282 length:546 start_codon:yes stop_codon:yes gene_type:complete
MNRLNGMRTYLAGAMDRVPDGGTGWREAITPALNDRGVVVLNPCDKPADVGIEDEETRRLIEEYKETGEYGKIRKEYGVIRTLDLRCVDVSDFIIASIDIDVHACGTYEEIAVANSQKKPVLVWCQQGKASAPNWLFFMLPHQHIFGSLSEIIEYLDYVDANEGAVEHYKRWFFFDRNKMS